MLDLGGGSSSYQRKAEESGENEEEVKGGLEKGQKEAKELGKSAGKGLRKLAAPPKASPHLLNQLKDIRQKLAKD